MTGLHVLSAGAGGLFRTLGTRQQTLASVEDADASQVAAYATILQFKNAVVLCLQQLPPPSHFFEVSPYLPVRTERVLNRPNATAIDVAHFDTVRYRLGAVPSSKRSLWSS
eukprot:gene9406-6738_t